MSVFLCRLSVCHIHASCLNSGSIDTLCQVEVRDPSLPREKDTEIKPSAKTCNFSRLTKQDDLWFKNVIYDFPGGNVSQWFRFYQIILVVIINIITDNITMRMAMQMDDIFGEVVQSMPVQLVEPVERMINRDVRYRPTMQYFVSVSSGRVIFTFYV